MRHHSFVLRRCQRWAAVWFVGLLLLHSRAAVAIDGGMLIVTANPGKIMADEQVLAEVAQGTRLWGFAQQNGWYEVKVPHGEQHGWLPFGSCKLVELTTPQKAERFQANTFFKEAGELIKAQQFAAARPKLEQGLAIERRLYGDHPEVADTINDLGIRVKDLGDLSAARKYHAEALALYRQFLGNDNRRTASALHNLGNDYSDLGDYATARQYCEEALAIKRKVLGNDHESTAGTINNLGLLTRQLGDYSAARKYFEESLAISRKALGNEHPLNAYMLSNLGMLANDQGDYAAAQKYAEATLAIEIKAYGREHVKTADTLNSLGVYARDQENFPAARKYLDEALAIKRKFHGNEHLSVATTLTNLGILAHDQQDLPAARKYYEEALAIERKVLGNDHPTVADNLNNLGTISRVQGDFKAARTFYEDALAINRKALGNEHKNTALTLNNLGTLSYSEGNNAAARKNFDDFRHIMRRQVQRILPGLSETEQSSYLENLYLNFWVWHLSFGWHQRADAADVAASAAWLVNGKAVAQETLAARALLTRDADNPQLAPLVKELAAVRQQLAALSLAAPAPNEAAARLQKLAQLASEEQRLARTLANATGQAPTERDWDELADIRAAIPANAIYIDFVRMGIYDLKAEKTTSYTYYLVWIIPAQGEIQIINLGKAGPIDEAIEKARASLANASKKESLLSKEGEAAATQAVQTDLQAAADLVLKPLLPQLANKQQVILSPDGALWLLPWAALPTADNKCLLEQCSLRYITSGRDLVKKSGTSKLGTTAPAIIVNPDYDLVGAAAKAAIRAVLPEFVIDENATRGLTSRSSLPRVAPLPFTSLEGAAAKPSLEQLTKSEPRLYEQDKALEAVVKKIQRPKHLLFATHGFFLPDQDVKHDEKQDLAAGNDSTRSRSVALTTEGQPVENPLLRCGLLLAGCNAPRTPGLDDGILTGLEIVGMDLRGTELVVLSACETGIGQVRNGEGVAGLRQAFQLAGAQSVVSTLWQVPDRDSALIMQDFFTNLAAGQSKADALRNAQLKRIATRKEKTGAAHPFFWAAWTVTGE